MTKRYLMAAALIMCAAFNLQAAEGKEAKPDVEKGKAKYKQ